MRKILSIFIITLIFFLLTGCWNYREIDSFAIVSGITVDKVPDTDEYLINVEVVEVDTKSSGISFTTSLVESKGKSIYDAATNMIAVTTKKLYLSHATEIVISEDVARQGIIPILDWIARDLEIRLTIHPYISKEKTAKEILAKESTSTKIRTFEFEEIIKANNDLSKSPHIEANTVMNQISHGEYYPVLPTVELVKINDKSSIKLSGSAFFHEDILVGYLDPEQTKLYLFIVDEIKGGVIVHDGVTLDILKNKTKIDMDFSNENISITIRTDTDISIAQIENSVDYVSRDSRAILEEELEKQLENEIKTFIKDFQQEYGLDIFGFGNLVKKKKPSLWKSIKKDWKEVFQELDIKVESNVNIKSSGHLRKPIVKGH